MIIPVFCTQLQVPRFHHFDKPHRLAAACRQKSKIYVLLGEEQKKDRKEIEIK